MRTWWVGIVAMSLAAAGHGPHAVEVADPCGDIVYVEVDGERQSLQPDRWSSVDLEAVRIAETGSRQEGTYGVDVTFDVCGQIDLPDSPAGVWRTFRLEWGWGDRGCVRGLQVGYEGESVSVIGGIGVEVSRQTFLFESCPDQGVAGVVRFSTLATWELAPERLEVDGDLLTIRLSPTLDTEIAHWFAAGQRWATPRVWTRADAPLIGVRGCLPSDGPAGDVCGRAGDGDDAVLADLVLTG